MNSYPTYCSSGIEWIGDVPEHWKVTRLRDVAELINGFPFDSKLFEPSEGIPLVRIRDLFTATTEVRWAGPPVRSAEIGIGDILIGMDGDFSVAWWKHGPALLNQRLCCVRTLPDHMRQRFLFYCLTFPLQALNNVTYATTVKHLSSLDVLKFRLPLPPLVEQEAIVDYLDQKTERIDTLVSKQQLLIDRLEEYRVALIMGAVTGGFREEAVLQSSGIGWLGEIPEHWETQRLKFVASINDDTLSEREDPLRPIAYVDIGSVDSTTGITEMEEMVFEDAPSRARRLVRDGDTIVSTVRTYLRAIAPVSTPPPEMVVSTGFAVIRPRELAPGFASWVLRAQGLIEEIVARSTGVSYPAINASQIGDLPVPLPSFNEQQTIAVYLDRETERIRTVSHRIETAIERLQEYRTALITAAVTGKIDVRGTTAGLAHPVGKSPSCE